MSIHQDSNSSELSNSFEQLQKLILREFTDSNNTKYSELERHVNHKLVENNKNLSIKINNLIEKLDHCEQRIENINKKTLISISALESGLNNQVKKINDTCKAYEKISKTKSNLNEFSHTLKNLDNMPDNPKGGLI